MRRPTPVNLDQLRAVLADVIPPQHHRAVAAMGRMLTATFAGDTSSAASSAAPEDPQPPPAAVHDAAAASMEPLPPGVERFAAALRNELHRAGMQPRERPRSDIPLVNLQHYWQPDLSDMPDPDDA